MSRQIFQQATGKSIQQAFEPPETIIKDKLKYTYIETKTTNSKGQILSEKCYWYFVNGKREPMSKGNILALVTIA